MSARLALLLPSLLVLLAGTAQAQAVAVDGGSPPPTGDAGTAPTVAPAEPMAPRQPQGVPTVMTGERPTGPIIELPPETPPPQVTTPATPLSVAPPELASSTRTSIFSDLKAKAEAIINRTVLGGYGEFVFTKRQGEDSVFEPRRVVLFLYSPIHDRISLTAEIEWEHGGSPEKSAGQLTAGEVQLEFAVLDIKFFEQLVLRGGVVLVPLGRFNINHDAPTQDLSDRPLTLTYIIPSTWFEAGAGLLGRQRLSRHFDLNYEIYVVNGLDSKITPDLGYRAARGSKLQDNNDDKAVVGRVGLYFFGPVGKQTMQLDLGVSGYSGAYNRRGQRTFLLCGDLSLKVRGFELVAEVVRGWNDPGFDDDWPTSSRGPVPTDLVGFFAEAHYRFMPGFLRRALPSWLKDSFFTLAARYDAIDTDLKANPADRCAVASTWVSSCKQRITVGLNYRFIQAVAWKHELQIDHFGPADHLDNPKLAYVTSLAFLF